MYFLNDPQLPMAPPSNSVARPDGLLEPGNIKNLFNRKVLNNSDGSYSTTSSMSFEIDGKEVLVPTVIDGRRLSQEQAIENYRRTGEHLGIFSSAEAANKFATSLHEQQATAKPQVKLLPQPETRSLWERRGEIKESYSAYVKATENMQAYGANFTSRDEAIAEAYARRAAAVKAAIGVDLEVPLSAFEGADRTLPFEERTLRVRQKKFDERLRELQALHPGQAAVIRADVPIERDAEEITRGAVAGMAEAERKAETLPFGLRAFGGLEGSIKGMLRDPVQIYTLGFGAGSKAVTAGGRMLSVALTEAAVNGAAEIPVQLAAENWRRQSGVPLGWSGMWQQVGLAAAFGGGFGGLLQGGSEVLRSLGKATPATDAAFTRMREGSATVDDVQLIVEAVGAKIDEPDLAALSRAIEDDADDALVMADGADGSEVGQIVAAIENDLPVPRAQSEILPPGNFEFFNPDELTIDAARFQFKEGGDAAGVTDRLRGVTEWKSERAGVAVVFEDASGKRFVADGHQRVGLAKRIQGESGTPVQLPGYVFREADGYTAGDVRVIAALKNIGEGSGTALDAAKVLRSGKFDVKATGLPPASALVRDAAGLARLSDDAFAMAVNEVIDPKLAAVVGRLADDQALHAQMISVLKDADAKTIGEAQSMVRDLLTEPTFVERQESLFGEADVARMLLKEKAAVRGATLRALRKDRAVFNSLIEEQKRIAETGNVLDTAANTERAKSDAIIIEAIDRLSRQVGPVATALNDAATAVAGGAGAQTASRGFVDAVRDEIRKAGGNLARIGEREPAQLLDAGLAGSKLTEPATPEAAEAAAQALDAASPEGLRSTGAAETSTKADLATEKEKLERGRTVWTKAEENRYHELNALIAQEDVKLGNLPKFTDEQAFELGFYDGPAVRVHGKKFVTQFNSGSDSTHGAAVDDAVAEFGEDAVNQAMEAGEVGWVYGKQDTFVRSDQVVVGKSPAAEKTDAGLQVLIPGLEPVTIKKKLEVEGARPMRGGDALPPAGGLFDDVARAQLDIMDALPAGTDAAGKPLLTTHAELAAQADRVDHLADVISSCRG